MAEPLPDTPQLSIIIPVLNEADCLDQNLARLFTLQEMANLCEVIISDGGSTDESLAIASRYPCRIVRSGTGRALQLNTASKIARGKFLLFLHADSSLPTNLFSTIEANAQWGFFRLHLSGTAFVYRVIESTINLRSGLSHVAGGDQGLYFNRKFFESLNGYPEIPLMEDIALCKLARRHSKPAIVKSAITSSSRRWQEKGVLRTVLLMWTLRLAYWLGVNPRRLYRIYYPQRG